jgi:two-component system cell cycle response regulator
MDFEDTTQVFDPSKLRAERAQKRAACLIVIAGSQAGRMYKLDSACTYVIGRATDATLRIEDEGVSRHHAKVSCDATGAMVLQDLGSTNGTFCNGNRITQHVLQDGDKLQVGSITILKFSYQDAVDEDFQRQQYEMATRDGLTGCFNKKYFMERFPSEFGFALRHKNPICLAMFDIDHFKKINDTYGHPAGDHVLRGVGQQLLAMTRRSDVLARYGGEEFAAVMREVLLKDALVVAERIRTTIGAQKFVFNGQTLTVTISIGLGQMSAQSPFKTPEELMQSADNFLYKAKKSGRNRTECDLTQVALDPFS